MIRSAASGVRATVAPPPHGARMTNASSASPLASDPGRLGRREPGDGVAAILAGALAIERDHARQVAGARRIERRRAASTGGEADRLEDPVLGLDLEPHPLVQPAALVRRDEHERSAAGAIEPADDRLGDRAPEAAAAPGGLDEDRADPAHRAVRRPDARRDDRSRPPRRRTGSSRAASSRTRASRGGRPSRCAGSSRSPARRRPADMGRRNGVGMPFSIIRRWLDSPARTSSTSRSSRASG